MNKEKITTFLAYLTVGLLAAQAVLFLASWLVTAMMPDMAVHSLLSSEGIRWFFGSFVGNVASPVLVWLLILAMAISVLVDTRLLHDVRRLAVLPYRPRFALQFVAFELFLFVVVVIMMALVPHAPLLSVTGQLFPSSFSRSIIPMTAFWIILMSVTYGLLSGKMKTGVDVFQSITRGLSRVAPLILVYIVAAELFCSLIYVFGT
ncbi:MAG: AbgT family transporter [Prevotella sp.]|nr:AbgT family transporter [Prevotella sp.]